jgi:hypothetical protein
MVMLQEGGFGASRDVVIHAKSGSRSRVSDINPMYDLLIMFCFIRIDILVGAQKNDIQLGDHFLP